jgi:hypothetical protein
MRELCEAIKARRESERLYCEDRKRYGKNVAVNNLRSRLGEGSMARFTPARPSAR